MFESRWDEEQFWIWVSVYFRNDLEGVGMADETGFIVWTTFVWQGKEIKFNKVYV